MDNRERDARIAEWCGWKMEIRESGTCLSVWWVSPAGESMPRPWFPPYSTDLNAMAEAERVVAERGLIDPYLDALFDILPCVPNDVIWDFATATAAQRAEALCRVIDALEEKK